jgi:hypothetical protein
LIKTLFRSIVLCFLLSAQFAAPAQQPAPQSTQPDPRVDQILNKAVEVLGGPSYLNVRSVTSRGFYTPFVGGVSQYPARFTDYIVYPDRERTEFITSGIRTIQTNSGNSGWVFDGGPKTIKDMSSDQIEDFKRSMRTSLENLLRGWWKNEGGKLTYAGRREAGLARRNETVRLTYPDGFWIEYEFGAKDGLPAKIIYKRNRKNPDTGDMEEATEEERLAKPIAIDGVTAPWVIDHFTNNAQTSRTNYESVEYNKPIPDSLFAKPDNVKSIK